MRILTLVGLGIDGLLRSSPGASGCGRTASPTPTSTTSWPSSRSPSRRRRPSQHAKVGHRDHAEHDPGGLAVRRPAADSPASRPRPTPTTSSPCTSRRSAAARPTRSCRRRRWPCPRARRSTRRPRPRSQTVFQGTTLRGLLLEAYAFWQMGQIALYAAIACFVLAVVMLIFTILGFVHWRRTPEEAEI